MEAPIGLKKTENIVDKFERIAERCLMYVKLSMQVGLMQKHRH